MADLGQGDYCALFTVLPVEVRLHIYEALFEGSEVRYKKKHTVGSRTQLSILQPSDHHNFLLTCNQAYDEAIKIYWSKTTLYGDPDDDELTFFLGCIVPDIAKPYIRHIRGLNSGELPDRPLQECLEDYQRLQTIGFEEEGLIDIASLGDHGASPTMEDWVEENCRAQSSWKFSSILRDAGPTVVFRGVYRLDVEDFSPELLEEKFPHTIEDLQNERKICFYNYSTDWGFFADDFCDQKDLEAGFAKVLEDETFEEKDYREVFGEDVAGPHE
ncbi:hypothetical protein KVR01_008109 [Diaporthe batatas]|uniref:uncharacterized protein n=1 Tax=Diaporthe batatas TaxID=748121 RepID=UPI001D0375E8|nr:uncharacterized protein KVR01_008109 [Diaporthe batatas]KAG8162344.1 hypothetical protein KVR01_008109 [Diaporthe batatas]